MTARGDPLSFTVNRAKLNSKFESYKLRLPSEDQQPRRYRLPRPFRLASAPDHIPLSYAETQARAEHNHLVTGLDGNLAFIDCALRFHAIEVKSLDEVIVHELVQLPAAQASSSKIAADYPVAIPLSASTWCISDGVSTLYIVEIVRDDPRAWKGVIKAQSGNMSGVGHNSNALSLRLLAASATEGGETIVIVTSPVKTARPSSQPACSSTCFAIACFRLAESADDKGCLEPIVTWKRYSDSIPFVTALNVKHQRAMFAGSHPLSSRTTSSARETLEQANEHGTDFSTVPAMRTTANPSLSPPAFSWLQDTDSLTLAFALPSITPTSSIRIVFSRQHVTVHIAKPSSAASSTSVHDHSLPQLSHKKLWDEIDPHTSIWTFDREAEGRDSTFGLLTLHLEKKNAGTKWMHVFEPTITTPGAVTNDEKVRELTEEEAQTEFERVAETLDPSELAKIVEQMEQWTQTLSTAEMGDARSMNEVHSSLLGEEIDAELDADSGRPTVVTWIEDALETCPKMTTPHTGVPFPVLSLPLRSGPSAAAVSFVVKHDVDGLVFVPPTAMSPLVTHKWTHDVTFPALAFVLASKRDATFVRHIDEYAVLAFDAPVQTRSRSSEDSANLTAAVNVFVYYRPQAQDARNGVQTVIKLGGFDSGSLLGVAGVRVDKKTEQVGVCALCENELVFFTV
ncbi:hypothetical protein OIO90_000982 [Microbotryomycetes sp. JL221]|nr:hypothetical protein OIO90_000982 [Microbotryomycetes sp. JL221]